MIKIEKYKVSNYKNIKEAELTFSNMNIVIGPNNSGKSNLLQSISFLNFIINSGTLDDLEFFFKGGLEKSHFGNIIPLKIFYSGDANYITSFNLKFSNSETNRIFNYVIDIEGKSDGMFETKFRIVHEKLDVKELGKPGKPEVIFERNSNNVNFGDKLKKTQIIENSPDHFSVIRFLKVILPSEYIDPYEDAVESLNSVVKTNIFYFSNLELTKSETDRMNIYNGRTVSTDISKEIFRLEDSKNWDIFKSVLNNVLNIDNVSVEKYTFDNKDKNKRIHKFVYLSHLGIIKNINNFSDGTLLVIAIVAKILNSTSDIFFLEEPENSTHPKALVDLFNFLKSYSLDKQFIITSHSIALLNNSNPKEIIVGTIDEDGASYFTNISEKRELVKKLKHPMINFSDELFFGDNLIDEFE